MQSMNLSQGLQNYGIAELALTWIVCSLHDFSLLLKHQYFKVSVDSKTIENLQKDKDEQSTSSLIALLLKLHKHTFELKYQTW